MIHILYYFCLLVISACLAWLLPIYGDLGRLARINSMEMVAQSLRNISNDVHAEYLSEKRQNSRYVALQHQQIALQDGFPAASESGIVAALQLPRDYVSIITQSANTMKDPASVMIQYHRERVNCWVRYLEANNGLSQYTPSIELELSGC